MFSKFGATNHKFWNFLEYKLRGSQNRCFALPNFSFGKTTLNNNIKHQHSNKFQGGIKNEKNTINEFNLNDWNG
jgi:hypothetical protein